MMRWYGLMAALCAIACADSKQSELPASDWVTWTALGMEHFTLPVRAPTRTDTLRDSAGKIFSTGYTSSVALTSTGNVAVIDNTRRRLLLFDSSGREIHRVDIAQSDPVYGDWPIAMFVLPGDSIGVWLPQRISLFDSTLKLDRTERLAVDSSDRESSPVGRLHDGRWVWRVGSPMRTIHRGSTIGEDFKADTMVTPSLMVGGSDEAPAKFYSLQSSRGARVPFGKGRKRGWQTIWQSSLQVRQGVVCERGAVILDPDSIRTLDQSGRVVSVLPLPRNSDTIRTEAIRARMVKQLAGDPLGDNEYERSTHSVAQQFVDEVKVVARRPLIDSDGRLWYFRRDTTHRPSLVLDRVDSAGQPDAAFLREGVGYGVVQIGPNAVANVRYGADKTAIITVDRFVERFSGAGNSPLGRCSAAFYY